MSAERHLVEVKDLQDVVPDHAGNRHSTPVGDIKAVDGLNFGIRRGETLGLVGESRLRQIYDGPRPSCSSTGPTGEVCL
jgi:ABC-type glutathione transport system ATPase component